MFNILSESYKSLIGYKIIVMNNKMSFYILFAFLFISFSCKSESKSNVSIANDADKIEVAVENTESTKVEPVIREVEVPKLEEKVEKEISMPTKKNDKKAPKQAKQNKNNSSVEVENKERVTEKPPIKAVKDVVVETKEETKVEVKEPKKEVVKEVEVEKPSKPEVIETMVGIPKHTLFDRLLQSHVSSSGVVDYAALKKNEGKLDEYLGVLKSNPPGTTWNRNDKLTYWINAYNAFTIKLILDNYPVKSITDLHSGKPWDVKWIEIDGKTLSLNNIENDIIRPKFNEPRIHFAVNCAAKSCPPILNSAYKSRTLDAQLESQTKKFINNPKFNTLGKSEVSVSKIFEWYGVDFGDVASFVSGYSDTVVKPSAKVSFMEYDWSLNGK